MIPENWEETITRVRVALWSTRQQGKQLVLANLREVLTTLCDAVDAFKAQSDNDLLLAKEIAEARDKVVAQHERTKHSLAVSESKLHEAREVLNNYVRFHNKHYTYSGTQLRDMYLRAEQVLADVKFVSYKHVDGDAECPCNECRLAVYDGCEFCNGQHDGESCQSPAALQYHSFNKAQSLVDRNPHGVAEAVEALALLPFLLKEMRRLYEENESYRAAYAVQQGQIFKLRYNERATRRFLDAMRAHANQPHDAALLAEESEAYDELLALLEPEVTKQ